MTILACLVLSQVNAQILPEILINEFKLGEKRSYIELLVVGDLAQENEVINLNGWLIDNNSTELPNDQFQIKLGTCFSNLTQGTLILIYDDQHPHPAIDLTQDGTPNANGVYQVPLNSTCIEQCDLDQANCSQSNLIWSNSIHVQVAADVLEVKKATGNLVTAVNWAGENYEEHQNEKTITFEPENGIGSIQFSMGPASGGGNSLCDLSPKLNQVPSPGGANGPGNGGMINTVITGGTDLFALDCFVNENAEVGTVETNMINGSPDFTLEIVNEGLGGFTTSDQSYTISGLQNGDFIIKATDADGCAAFCNFSIARTDQVHTVCPGSCVTIGEEDHGLGLCYKWIPEPPGYQVPYPSKIEVCPTEDIKYTLEVSYNGELLDRNVYEIEMEDLPVRLFPDDPEILICDGKPFYLAVGSPRGDTGAYTYLWSTGETSERIYIDPNAPGFEEGEYSVVVTRVEDGCSGMASTIISLD